MKIPKWHVEYTGTLLVLFMVGLFLVPTSFETPVMASNITKWKDIFRRLTYVQDVILKQEQSEILTSFRRATTLDERESIVIKIIKPYFRVGDKKVQSKYKVRYMNKKLVNEGDFYHIDDYYYAGKHLIVGIKDLPTKEDGETSFLMTFDINGRKRPNQWGKDVYGAKVYADRVEPIGMTMTVEKQYTDCSKNGSGTCCSNYYLIGGNFDD